MSDEDRSTRVDAEPMAEGEGVLEARDIHVDFDGVRAVDSVDVRLNRGETLGLIGPNGAGKTTLVNAITGFQRPTQGRVLVDGIDVTRWKPARLAEVGVVRTFQAIRVFPRLTVLENVEVGALKHTRRRATARQRAVELVSIWDLDRYASHRASTLPHGAQRRLGLARAIATRPRYLMLDEPAAGLSEAESDQLVSGIRAYQESSQAGVLIIEHDMRVIMGICDRIHVLDFGKTILVGTPRETRASADVIAAYLGHQATDETDTARRC
jgi:branched-chain amino acid transport system ATP-binding protein